MEPEQSPHNEAMLLPDYVKGTLPPGEEQQVAHHLATCAKCQKELQEVTSMQTAIQTSIEKRPGPSPAAFSTLMRRIEQEREKQHQQSSQPIATSWWETIESTFRSLFEVQWVPALASILIVGQAFLLLSLIGTPEGHLEQSPGVIIQRGIPQGTPQVSLLKIKVEFQAGAQEQQIREMLHKIEGRIIDGPSSNGTYTLAVTQHGSRSLDSLLIELRQETGLIRLAEPLLP